MAAPELNLNAELCDQLSKCIENLTTSGEKTLDEKEMKTIKKICRSGDEYVKHIYHLIMHQMVEEHAEIRYSSLLITDYLFRRSHSFREALVSEFQTFLELTVEIDPDQKLPPPLSVANALKAKAIEFINDWNNMYGKGYKKLELGFNFLKECKKVDFSNISQNVETEADRKQNELLKRQEKVLNDNIEKVRLEMNECFDEIEISLTTAESCFQLLIPSEPEETIDDLNNPQPCCSKTLSCRNDNSESFSLLEHGIFNSQFSVDVKISKGDFKVTQNNDNDSVVEALVEQFHIVQRKYLPMVLRWTQILGKAKSQQENLRKSIDLKNQLQLLIKKCNLIGVADSNTEQSESASDSDNDFIEVEPKEGYEPVIPQHKRKEYGLEPLSQPPTKKSTTSSDWTLKPQLSYSDELSDPTSMLANLSKAPSTSTKPSTQSRSTVDNSDNDDDNDNALTKDKKDSVPTVRYDMDLYHWEDKDIKPPTVVKFDSLHRFWQPSETESEVARPEDVAAMRERVIDFSGNFEPVKWSCRAPLPSGKLCPRKDRVKCPFHGPVIPRDNMGNPSLIEDKERLEKEQEEKERANPEWQNKEFLKELESATGVDLTVKKNRREKSQSKKEVKGLADLNTSENTSRKRLEKKVFNGASVKRVSAILDTIDHKKHRDKFGDQFNYAYHT